MRQRRSEEEQYTVPMSHREFTKLYWSIWTAGFLSGLILCGLVTMMRP